MEENKTAARGEDIITSRNAITEALKAEHTIDGIYVARGNRTGSIGGAITEAKQSGIPVKDADPKKLDYLCGHTDHQGVVAVTAVKEYASLEDLFHIAGERGEPPFFLIADELEGPHNLGAILRTAECSGTHGVTVPRRRTVGLTFTIDKAPAETVECMPVARVTSLSSTLRGLKRCGVWIYAADMGGQDWCGVDYRGPATIVIGSEGFGVSRLIREESDFIISSPMLGKINSSDASVACGVICYEVVRQHRGAQAKQAKGRERVAYHGKQQGKKPAGILGG